MYRPMPTQQPGYPMPQHCMPMPQHCGCPLPIKPSVKVIHRCFYKDFCHVVPCHTHIVNHQINRHRYVPQYTCSQEQTCQDIHLGRPCC